MPFLPSPLLNYFVAGGIAAIFGWLGRRCQSRNARDVSKDTIISEEKQCQTASRVAGAQLRVRHALDHLIVLSPVAETG